MANKNTEQDNNGISEEERLQILEERTDDTKLSHLIRNAVNECLDDDNPAIQKVSEKRIRKIERDMNNIQTELVSIQEESLRLARRTLTINSSVGKLEKDLNDVGFKLNDITSGAKELKELADGTALDLRKLTEITAKDLKELATDRAKDLKELAATNAKELRELANGKARDLTNLAEHKADDLKEKEVVGWNRKQQTIATILIVISVIIAAIATIRGFY